MADVSTPPAAPPLKRSREDRVFAGVCGGIGNHLGVDPVWLRIAFVAMTLGGGAGVILYVLAILVIPEVGHDEVEYRHEPRKNVNGTLVIGGALVVVGVIALASQVMPWIDDLIWPAVLITLGLGLVWRAVHD